jgi:hypothetical protein
MKKILLTSLFAAVGTLLTTVTASATLISAWDFTSIPDATNGTPAIFNSVVGSATLDASAFSLGGPIQGQNPERTAFTGTATVNAFAGSDTTTALPTQMALAIANSTANGKSLLFSFNMAGYQDLIVSFAARGTSTGFNSGIWAWSTDNVSFTDLVGVNTATRVTTFGLQTADFSAIGDMDNDATVYLKYTLSGCTSSSGNNRLDNIQFNAVTFVPEPSTLALSVLGIAGLVGLRRKN